MVRRGIWGWKGSLVLAEVFPIMRFMAEFKGSFLHDPLSVGSSGKSYMTQISVYPRKLFLAI